MAKTIIERTPAHRAYLWGSWAIAIVAMVAMPFIHFPEAFGNPVGQINNWNRVLAFAVAVLGLNLLIGYSGQISIGHSAFIGLGAYATVILRANHGWNYFAALPAAALLSFVVGCIIGLPALRIKGLYLVVVTFAMAVAFPTVVLRYESITGGANGKDGSGSIEPPSWTGFDQRERLDPLRYRYFVLLIVAVIMFILARNMVKSRAGRALIAQRDNPIAATVNGVAVSRNKVLVFGLSAMYCGVAGWMLMINTPFAADTSFGGLLGITLIIGLVVGGGATISGAVPGAIVIVVVQYLLEQLTEKEKVGPVSMEWLATRQGKGGIVSIAFGLLLLASVFFLPGGIIDGIRRVRARLVRVVPRPAWLSSLAPNAVPAAPPPTSGH
jgi:branched-chain amino acid transport system permease protein